MRSASHLRRMATLVVAAVGVFGCRGATAAPGAARSYLFAFAGADDLEGGGSDFLAVIDADSLSPSYGRIVGTAPIHAIGTMPHHMELTMPPAGEWLFANGFMSGRTFLFDLANPLAPRLASTIDSVPGFVKPHSFWRLPDGNVLATLQYGDGHAPGNPGGLVVFSPKGRVVRSASAADPAFPAAPIRTYSLDVASSVDRVITTSSPMDDVPAAAVVQVWRLSDLTHVRTLAVPQTPGDTTSYRAFEARFLPGDSTALVNTWTCGVYLLTGLAGNAPRIERLFALPRPQNDGCGVPLVMGHFWILPVWSTHEYRVYDVADPHHLRQVSTLSVDTTYHPHWMAREAGSERVVLSSDVNDHRVLLAHFDSVAGVLSLDASFRDPGASRPGVDFARRSWPHGDFGPAMPHGVIFSARAALIGARP